jgi:hypothetical protein
MIGLLLNGGRVACQAPTPTPDEFLGGSATVAGEPVAAEISGRCGSQSDVNGCSRG